MLACGVLLVACGGNNGEGDVEGLLDRAFRQPIGSAHLKVDGNVTVDGLKGFERPVRLEATGAYIGGRGALPKLDVDITLGAQGAGQTVQFGFLRTADRAFVKFGGEFYEQSREGVARANRELSAGRARRGGSLRDLGLLPRTWVVGAREVDEEKVGGVATRHVTGTLDMRSMLRDLGDLAQRSGRAVGAGGDVPDPLSSEQLDKLADTVRKPSFDVYIGKDDDVIRRFSAQLQVVVPEEDSASAGGVKGGTMRFSIEFDDVGGDQVVEAPAKARPFSDLTKQLGGLGSLGGVGALAGEPGAAADGTGTPPTDDRRGADANGSSGSSGGVETFRRYSDCLDKAGPDDTKALSRCALLLR